MSKPFIPKEEFVKRIENIRNRMKENGLDAVIVYGDEYRREQLRYVSNFWPIFDRSCLLIGKKGEPILLTAPESQRLGEEMSPWEDVRLIPDLEPSYIPETIDYPLANYESFASLGKKLRDTQELNKLGIVGVDAMSKILYDAIIIGFNCECVNSDSMMYDIRLIKSEKELECMREAGRLAQVGIKEMMKANLIGMTETAAAAIAEHEARKQGAEAIAFSIFATGKRSNNIVPRATRKIIEDGDMMSCGLAVQYEGYIATCQVPFAVGNMRKDSWKVIDTLIRANEICLKELRPGNPMKNLVTAVRDVFRAENLEQYDVYPPMHGSGYAEAESPYPDENTEKPFLPGMCVNTDISLFGAPGDSSRIEGCYIVTEHGYEAITPFVDEYCADWIKNREKSPFYES